MVKHRIVIIEYNHPMAGDKRTFAVQRRVALFWWFTEVRCYSLSQCRYWLSGVSNRHEKVIKFIE